MKYIYKKFGILFAACALVLSVIVPCLASAAVQRYYIRPLRTGDTIYYDNSISEWSTVKIYIFSLAEQTHPFEWDERPDMTYVDNNIWEYTVTAGSNIEGHDYDYVIFTNGKSGSDSRQTVDIGFVGNGYAYKSDSWEGSKRSGYWYLYDTTAVTLEYVTALKTGDVIYFDNSGTNWDGVNVYMYNPDNTGSGSGPFAWNGTAMTYVSGGIYEYTVPADINIESYNDTHVVFSNTAGSSQTIDLGFFKSGYAYKVESWKDGKGTGYWYVYDKSSLQEAIDEVSSYVDKLGCLSPTDYTAATQAITDANRAMVNEIPEETGVPGEPGAYWNQANAEISNLQSKLASLKETYGETPTVCTFSPTITKTITNPQEYYKLGDTVDFQIDVTNTAEFDVTATITEDLNGVVFSDPSTDDYTVISDQVVETKTMSAGETVSLYATYPVASDITEQYTNIVEITSASTTEAGYYLSESDHTASAVFDTKSWMDIPSSTACTLSSTITSGDEHTATILPGAYKDNIGKTEIKALCNDNDGFSIYAVGYSNNTEGTNTMIGLNTGSTIATGTSTEGGTSNWAMKLTKITDPSVTFNPNNLSISGGYDSYSPVPSTPTKVVEYKDSDTGSSSATDQTKGAHIETTYAAYVTSAQPADTYNGKVKYLLVHPANFTTGTYSIAYNANGGAGTMDTETNIPNYEPHTLAASTLTAPAGYMLAGWCDTQDTEATAENPQTSCAGTSYADQATIPASTVASGSSLTLYAYWQKPTMQGVSNWKNTLNVGDEMVAVDERDGTEYYVAKLADNNIWMVQNLDLNLDDQTALTPTNTNVSSNWTPERSTIATGNLSSTTWPNGQYYDPYSYDPGDVFYYSSGSTSDDSSYPTLAACQEAHSDCSMKNHVGNYYNWSATVASNDTSTKTTGYDNATDSICPAGWKLPKVTGSDTTTTGSEWGTLLKKEDVIADPVQNSQSYATGGFNTIRTAPLWLARSGDVISGSLYNTGYSSYYWSSTVYNSNDAFHLHFRSGYVSPASTSDRGNGYSVRCLAE